MFGYVVVEKPSLRIREYDYYRATYCGLCHTMGKCTGCLSRMTLSYDMAFFVLVREMLEGEQVHFEKKRCVRHPIKKIQVVSRNSQLEYSAYVGGLLTSGKIADNINDEKGIKSAFASFLKLFFSKMEKKSSKELPTLAKLVDEKLSALAELEKNKVASIDAPADIFGSMMSALLSYELDDEKKLIAETIGKRLGRWVYIVDAFDDYEKDRKSGSYNPFVLLYSGDDFSEDNLKSISMMLEAEMAMVCAAIDLLDEDADINRREIVRNILCAGMPASVKRVCDKKKEK